MKRYPAHMIVTLVLLLGVAACSRVEPFLYQANAFNRAAENFGREPTDIARVDICYARAGTSPQVLNAMASEECGRFGKVPRYVGQDARTCPLLAPVRITFDCVIP